MSGFLQYLFDKIPPLQVSTIRGYRSAISASIPEGLAITESTEISQLVKSFAAERPKVKKFVPQWHLNTVLSFLVSDKFEPLSQADPEFLTFKALFLILLASGRRVSEVHSLVVDANCLRFNRDFSEAQLLTEPGFRAKNQRPGDATEPIVIPALGSGLPANSPTTLLCPVRALRAYLNWSNNSGIRGERRRVFIHFDPAKPKEIDTRQLARWTSKLIQLAYQWKDSAVPENVSFHCHEVRGLASSWAAYNNVAIDEIMRAAYWRTPTTFHDHYLKHLAAFSDGFYSAGPLVVAQSVIVPPGSRTSHLLTHGGLTTQRAVPLVPSTVTSSEITEEASA